MLVRKPYGTSVKSRRGPFSGFMSFRSIALRVSETMPGLQSNFDLESSEAGAIVLLCQSLLDIICPKPFVLLDVHLSQASLIEPRIGQNIRFKSEQQLI